MDGNRISGRRRQRENAAPPPPDPFSSFNQATFPLLLAASANVQNPRARSIIKRSLRFHLSLLARRSTPPYTLHQHQLLPQGLLSLLPLLLTTRYPSVSALSAEVVGTAALCSLEVNAMIASDRTVVKGLVRALGNRSRRSVEMACNAIMDLSTSSIGRDRLRDSFAIEKLLSLFCQVATTTLESVTLQSMREVSSDCSRRDYLRSKLLSSVLDAVVTLINTSSEDWLDRISEELIKRSLPLLKKLWDKIKCSTLPSNCSWEQSISRSAKYDLAAVIFRFSMNRAHYATWGSDEIRISVFGRSQSGLENFILKYWEESPLILRRASENLENDNTLFSSLIHSFNAKSTDSILNSLLHGSVSCPPIGSEELDIFSFLNETKGVLGSPIIYGQDIRVLKTQKMNSGSAQGHANKEVHFFKGDMGSELKGFDCVKKCREAFLDGYTVALRGIEFRNEKVAAIAEGLADLFGQPSVGANIYLTPPGSQGLARHYDDHCVFVCQVFGHKKWRTLPRTTTLLPRLYEPLGSVPGLESDACEGMQYLLQEEDILYIPRGYPHEAHTTIDESQPLNETATMFSLHLTLGIEVEPPFEWEGFAHVALHCWNEKQKQASGDLIGSKSGKQRVMFVNLLHVAIRLIADLDPIFRKACMAAALPFSCNTEGNHHAHALLLNQKVTFGYIINRIDASSSFIEALKSIEAVVQERDDGSLQWMRWLQHLPQEGCETEKVDYNNLLGAFEDFVGVFSEHIEEAVIEFDQIKSRFCRHAVFEDACRSFKLLLEKYRKTRKQYINGMLSLHSTY